MIDPLERIAAALERLSPPPPPAADPRAHPAYVWRNGALAPVHRFAPLPLAMLIGIDRQKAALIANLRHLASGYAAQDVLLWGARGTGKSALVKSAVAAVQAEDRDAGALGGSIALVEVSDLGALPTLFAALAQVDRSFVVFVDDLGFDVPADARALRSMLEGGAEPRPANIRLAVTANRRHLAPRDIAEQDSAINPRDSADDHLALADRFGLSLGFHALDQDGYVAIVAAYAKANDLSFEPRDAIGWATRRGSRSGRVAWQFIVDIAGRAGKPL